MKLLVLIFSLFAVSLAQAGHDYRLEQLRCTASNGVKIETLKKIDSKVMQGLEVVTKLGSATQRFHVQMPVISYGAPTNLVLTPLVMGPVYVVRVNLDPSKRTIQRLKGALNVYVNPYYTTPVAAVNCYVQVSEK